MSVLSNLGHMAGFYLRVLLPLWFCLAQGQFNTTLNDDVYGPCVLQKRTVNAGGSYIIKHVCGKIICVGSFIFKGVQRTKMFIESCPVATLTSNTGSCNITQVDRNKLYPECCERVVCPPLPDEITTAKPKKSITRTTEEPPDDSEETESTTYQWIIPSNSPRPRVPAKAVVGRATTVIPTPATSRPRFSRKNPHRTTDAYF